MCRRAIGVLSSSRCVAEGRKCVGGGGGWVEKDVCLCLCMLPPSPLVAYMLFARGCQRAAPLAMTCEN